MENFFKRAEIVVGLGFGDEGKGTITDFLTGTRNTDAVVRFSGGPQTAHNVITDDGKHHTFAQFGSGTFNDVPTVLSRFMMVNPLNMLKEAHRLEELIGYNPLHRAFISENALLISEVHRSANRAREAARGAAAHGSCAQGVGEAMEYAVSHDEAAPRMGDTRNLDVLTAKLQRYYDWVAPRVNLDEMDVPSIAQDIFDCVAENPFQLVTDADITNAISSSEHIVFEGSQGVLLDEWYGFHPHTTWSTTTNENALTLLAEAGVPQEDIKTYGVTRTYTTRHGYGPFPSEFNADYDWQQDYPEPHNKTGVWQGSMRAGFLDMSLLEYAVDVMRKHGSIDAIALTHCDVPVTHVVDYSDTEHMPTALESPDLDVQERYTKNLMSLLTEGSRVTLSKRNPERDVEERIVAKTGLPVDIKSYGPRRKNKMIKLQG